MTTINRKQLQWQAYQDKLPILQDYQLGNCKVTFHSQMTRVSFPNDTGNHPAVCRFHQQNKRKSAHHNRNPAMADRPLYPFFRSLGIL